MKIKYFALTAIILLTGKLYCADIPHTPIGQAIADSDLALVKKLIKSKQASVKDSAYEDIFEPLLNVAIYTYGHIRNGENKTGDIDDAREIITFLIDKGAPINIGSEQFGEKPLDAARGNNLPEIADLLISKGAAKNLRSKL